MITDKNAPAPSLPGAAKSINITLAEPIVRENGNRVEVLTLRKPLAGELRGLKVPDIVNGDVDTLITLLPRITSPVIGRHEAEALDMEDLGEIAGTIFSFFMNQTAKARMAELAA